MLIVCSDRRYFDARNGGVQGVGGGVELKGSGKGGRRRGIVGDRGKDRADLLLEGVVGRATRLLELVWLILLMEGDHGIGQHGRDLSREFPRILYVCLKRFAGGLRRKRLETLSIASRVDFLLLSAS